MLFRSKKKVAEGVAIVKQDYDLDQMVYVLDVDGEKVSFTYWDYEDDFNNPDIKDIYQQAQEQLGRKLSTEQVKAVARTVFKSFEQGVTEGIETIYGRPYEVDPNKYYVWAWDSAAVLYGEYDNIKDAKINLPKIEQRAIERLGPYVKGRFELSTGKELLQRYGEKGVAEATRNPDLMHQIGRAHV